MNKMKSLHLLVMTYVIRFVACRVTNSNRDGSVRDLSNLKRIYVKYVDGEKDSVKNKRGAMGGNVHHEFKELQYFAVSVPANLLSSLEADDAIEYIEDDFLRELIGYDKDNNGLRHLTKQRFLEEATPYGVTMVKAPEAWRLGHSGTGISLFSAPAFSTKMKKWNYFVPT